MEIKTNNSPAYPYYILVKPERSENVGAAARAIANFGRGSLHIVGDRQILESKAARSMAHGAEEYLIDAACYSDLETALADCSYALALTRRSRKQNKELDDIRTFVPLADERTAFVFGPESSGLSNVDLALCQAQASIPTSPKQPSINLAVAVAIVAFLNSEVSNAPSLPMAADLHEINLLRHGFIRLLQASGFPAHTDQTAFVNKLFRVFARGKPEQRDISVWWRFIRHLEKTFALSDTP
jgi:TrmH family RNA methyltransferase